MSEMPNLLPPDMDEKLARNIHGVPEHCGDGLLAYLRHGQQPGHFLMAVLSNDLTEACGRADEENRPLLYEYVYLLYNYAPTEAWGSPEKVRAWIERGRAARAEAAGQP